MTDAPKMVSVEIDRIFLDLENPRHEPYEDEGQVIEYLCKYENIQPLAKDIARNGLNPLELLALIPDEGSSKDPAKATYVVAEGNRRLCALKLLDDPERAPTKQRKGFENLAAEWEGVGELPCMVFQDREAVKMWLSRIHEGEQGGIGRKKWNADQTARHSGESKNKVALAVLDYAEGEGLITSDARKGKLTTVQRYLVNPQVRDALGLDSSNANDVGRSRPKADFDLLLRKFLNDLENGVVNSRANKDQHIAYARELAGLHGQTGKKIEPEPLASPKSTAKSRTKTKRPKKLKPRVYVPYEADVMEALEKIGGDKLPNLYNSICSISLESHTPIVSIGVWALFESLSAAAGRNIGTDFPSFFNKSRLQTYGLGRVDKRLQP